MLFWNETYPSRKDANILSGAMQPRELRNQKTLRILLSGQSQTPLPVRTQRQTVTMLDGLLLGFLSV